MRIQMTSTKNTKTFPIMSTIAVLLISYNLVHADNIFGGKNSFLNKPGGTGKNSVSSTLTENKNNLDKSLTENKNNLDKSLTDNKINLDKSLTDNKRNIDKDLEGLKRNLVTEFEYFIGTACAESKEYKTLNRKFNQGEISATVFEKEKERLKNEGKVVGCTKRRGAQVDQNGEVNLLDENGVPSEKPGQKQGETESSNSLPSNAEILTWNAKQEMNDLFTGKDSNKLTFWTFKTIGGANGFGYFDRSPASSMTTTVPSSSPMPIASKPSRSPIVHMIKLLGQKAKIEKEAKEYEKFSKDVERLRKTKTDMEISEYTVVYQGESYYGLSKIEASGTGPQFGQGSATNSDPMANELNLRQGTPADTIPFNKAVIVPVIDFYRMTHPDIKDEKIIENIKKFYDSVPKDQHDKEWNEIETNTNKYLY